MENLILIDGLDSLPIHTLITPEKSKSILKNGDDEWPIIINLVEYDNEISWDVLLYAKDGEQLLMKSAFKGINVKTDKIDSELFDDIKDIIGYGT